MKSKLDYTKDKLRVIVLELANNNFYEKPSTYLDELLNDVRQFKDINFECTFYLNIYCLCKENANAFRNEGHRTDITKWLCKSPIGKKIFPKTFDSNHLPFPLQSKPIETDTESPTTEIKSLIKQSISEILIAIDDKGWEYAFNTEADYNTFLDLLANYFEPEPKPYTLPKGIIRMKRGSKTKFAEALGEIHKKYSSKPFINDKEFFKIVKILTHFQKLKDKEIYKAATRYSD